MDFFNPMDLLIASIAVLWVFNYRLSRSILYPPLIFCSMWLLVLIVYRANLLRIDPLHTNTMLILAAGALVFSTGGFLAHLLPKQCVDLKIRLVLSENPSRSTFLRVLLLGTVIVAVPFFAQNLAHEASRGVGATVLERARNASVDEAQAGNYATNPVAIYLASLAECAAVLFLMEGGGVAFWIAVCIASVVNLAGGGRTGLLSLIAALTSVYLLQSNRLTLRASLRIVRIPLLLFVVLYVGLIFVNKNTSDISGGVGAVVVYFVVTYLIGPTSAFDHVVQQPSDFLTSSSHTFEFFLKMADSLHLVTYSPPPLLDQFIQVPFPTNVYTVYKFYFTDFGIVGCMACITGIGFLHTLLYRKAKTGSELALFIFGLSMFPVIMVVFDDIYYSIGFFLRAGLFCLAYLNLRGLSLRGLPSQKVSLIPPFKVNAVVRLLPRRMPSGTLGNSPPPSASS